MKLAKSQIVDLDLFKEQHADMCKVTQILAESDKNELDRIFAEGDTHGVGDVICNVWHSDLRKQQKLFMADQSKNIVSYVHPSLLYPCVTS